MMSKTRYIALPFGAGLAYAPRAGQFITPAPRSYATPEHAQLANPTGRLYAAGLDEGADRLDILARYDDAYPLTIREYRCAGIGFRAEGALVLRDMGPGKPHRWATHWRNDQNGGYTGGNYFEDFEEAAKAHQEDVARSRC